VAQGLTHIKIKVGRDLADDKKRCAIVREEIGPTFLMIDATRSGMSSGDRVGEAARPWKPLWIEEPTSRMTYSGMQRSGRR